MSADGAPNGDGPPPRVRVAVVGTGIAGLAAANALSKRCDVTLYERLPSLGMSAHARDTGEGAAATTVDVPIRVMYPAYYPRLLTLLDETGVETVPVDGSASFSFRDGSTYFRYRNLKWREQAIPIPWVSPRWALTGGTIAIDYLRFVRAARSGRIAPETTLREFLRRNNYSRAFETQFLLPVYATICTCTNAQLLDFPVHIVMGYAQRGLRQRMVRRAVGGAGAISRRLAADCHEIKCGAAVDSIRQQEGCVVVTTAAHGEARFEHVVVATQANHALRLVDTMSDAERSALERFGYTSVDVVLHSDRRLMPARRRSWAPANYFVHDDWSRPMATLWVNRVYPALAREPDVFQTVAPELEPSGSSVVSSVEFQRPLVTPDSLGAVSRLDDLMHQPGRRIWFCGSYARPGIPLLESAASSGLDVADLIVSRVDALSAPTDQHRVEGRSGARQQPAVHDQLGARDERRIVGQ